MFYAYQLTNWNLTLEIDRTLCKPVNFIQTDLNKGLVFNTLVWKKLTILFDVTCVWHICDIYIYIYIYIYIITKRTSFLQSSTIIKNNKKEQSKPFILRFEALPLDEGF